MKSREAGASYLYLDESGDSTFYDSKGHLIVGDGGCSPILIIGCLTTEKPETLRRTLHLLQKQLAVDEYLKTIPSMKKSMRAFHAKDDSPEVRQAVFKAILDLPFKTQFIVARKIEKVFTKSFGREEKKFYDSLISKLFERGVHLGEKSFIYIAKRGSRARQQPLEAAIRFGLANYEKWTKTKVTSQLEIQTQTPVGDPCLQFIDYMNWAVYRVFTKAESRYFDFVKDKISVVWDVYDSQKFPFNYYDDLNPIDIKKISPL